jgi:uncharacterized protein YjbI with pentapeptide repeats
MTSGRRTLAWLGALVLAGGACSPTDPTPTPEPPQASANGSAPPAASAAPLPTAGASPAAALLPAGAAWESIDLSAPAGDWSAASRGFNDVTRVGDRLVAVGTNGSAPLVALSDDDGLSWRTVAFPAAAAGETDSLRAVAGTTDGVVVAVGTHGTKCKFVGEQVTSCGDQVARIWRSDDAGGSWEIVKSSAFTGVGPEVSLVDVALGASGFVVVGNVSGPSKAGARAWTSADGRAWKAAVAFQPGVGWLARVTDAFTAGGEVFVAGVDVSCGDWFDNGFWVISGRFATSPLLWRIDGTGATPIELTGTGLPAPVKVACGGGNAPDGAGSTALAIGEAGGRPAVAMTGIGISSLGADLTWTPAPLTIEVASGASFAFAPGADRLVARTSDSRSGGMTLTAAMLSGGGWAQLGPPQSVPATPHGRVTGMVGSADLIVAVGSAFEGHVAAVWRSVPAPLPGAPSCDPTPGADCKGVDLEDADLAGRDLAGIDLRGANLSGANLAGAKLPGADLRGARMDEVNLAGADLSGAKLTSVNLAGVLDRGTAGEGLNLTGADLRAARIDLAEGMILDQIHGDQLTIRAVEPVAVSLVGAHLRFASLSSWQRDTLVAVRADFSGADLRNLGVRDVGLADSMFTGANVGRGLATGLWFSEGTPCPNGKKPVEMIGFQMWTCGLP